MAGLPQANGAGRLAQSPSFGRWTTTARVQSFSGGEGSPTQVRCQQNEKERLIHRACLPYDPRLKRILPKSGYSLRLTPRDVRDCFFYLFQVDDKRFKRQITGRRVPESWFGHLEDESRDLLPLSGFKPWLSSDLTDPPNEPNHVPGYVQVAIAGFVMDNKNAVVALQNAHRRQLLSFGALTMQSLLLLGMPFPREQVFGDVYIGDLAVLAMVETSSRAITEDQERMDRAYAMYITPGMPIKKSPGDCDFEGAFGALTSTANGKSTGSPCADEPPLLSPLVSELGWVSTERS